MSDTDSDLNFESADEDTEQELSEKSNVAVRPSANNDAEKNLNEQFSSNVNISANNSDLIKKDEVSNETSALIPNENAADRRVKSSVFSEPAAENTGKCVSNNPQHEKQFNEITNEKAKNTSTSTIENTTESAPNDSQPEKQRVTLRLEKKLKQKHDLPKQISSETEESSSTFTPTQSEGKSSSSWGFSSWGTSLLSTAASSVTTFTSQVSQGIGTVLETVENTLGVPPPEELATAQNKQDTNDSPSETKVPQSAESSNSEKAEENEKSESRPSLLPSWTKVLENTGSKVIMGGLDTLEMIGKKTFDILTEGDPGLRKKRAAFSPNMNLSQLLREAKAAADEKDEPSSEDIDRVNYSQIFDEYQGLVHLEALEMLSRQSQAKIQRLMIKYAKNTEVKNKLEEIQTICENLPSADDLSECEKLENFELELKKYKKYAVQLNLPLNVDNIVKVQRKIDADIKKHSNLTEISEATPEEIYRSAIHSLAEFTSKCIEAFQKVAELILVQSTIEQNLEQCATNLTWMTTVMCLEVDNLSSRYHRCLDSLQGNSENPVQFKAEDITFKVTNLYLEV
ncbi:protein FAM114A2-like [Stegodyphus dumicola]|uniref:protein FAM114A2-like n=1 Tax=Stegodyphus dumicola TaxID=202533 RepID=UPI0015ADCC9E|nr:protein FAM114A2-like [Stegodyphus dumicola]